MKKHITPYAPLDEIFKRWPECIRVFYRYGLSCVGCPMARLENVQDVSRQYGISLTNFVTDLNNATKKRRKK